MKQSDIEIIIAVPEVAWPPSVSRVLPEEVPKKAVVLMMDTLVMIWVSQNINEHEV